MSSCEKDKEIYLCGIYFDQLRYLNGIFCLPKIVSKWYLLETKIILDT